MELPIIDLQNVDLRALDQACRNLGFFALRGHGLSAQQYQRTLQFAQRFFEQSLAAKNEIRRTETNMWGFYDAELTKNKRDWKEILDIGEAPGPGQHGGSIPQWPAIDGFRDQLDQTRAQLHDTGLQVVRHIGSALGATEDLLAPFHPHTSFLRLNYYPTCPDPAHDDHDLTPRQGELGISHHTDAGAVTMLMLDAQPGLQFYNDGRWHLVDPMSDALIINIGDVVQVWSNDRYRAPLHRVLADQHNTRISIPYFLNPGYDCDYQPLPSLINSTNPALYRPINWGEFRRQRSLGDYADYGDEIQISDYRVSL